MVQGKNARHRSKSTFYHFFSFQCLYCILIISSPQLFPDTYLPAHQTSFYIFLLFPQYPQYNVTAKNPHCPNQEIQNTDLKISKFQTMIGKLHWLPSKEGESVHNYKNTLINRNTQMTESKFWVKIFKHFIKYTFIS